MKELRRCKSKSYCNFEVVKSNKEVQKEVCRYCGRRVIYYMTSDGKMEDEQGYLEDHIRDFCQPYGWSAQVFDEIYGPGKRKEMEALKAEHDSHFKNQQDLGDEFKKAMKERSVFSVK